MVRAYCDSCAQFEDDAHGLLVELERRASQWTAEARGELRKKESRAVLDRLKDVLDGPLAKNVLPAGNLR